MLCPPCHGDNNTALVACPTALSTLLSTYQPSCRTTNLSSPPPQRGKTSSVLTGGRTKCSSNMRWGPSASPVDALSLWGSARAALSPCTPGCSARRGEGGAGGHRHHERVPAVGHLLNLEAARRGRSVLLSDEQNLLLKEGKMGLHRTSK